MFDSDDYYDWREHENSCTSCGDWMMEQRVLKRGYVPSDFPCIHIAEHVTDTCSMHDDPWECPDRLIVQKDDGRFVMRIRDGGSSGIEISYCPWCGTSLSCGK